MTIFMNGKQKRVKRPPTIDGMDVDEFIRANADPIWLHQNEMWEYMTDDDEAWFPNQSENRRLFKVIIYFSNRDLILFEFVTEIKRPQKSGGLFSGR